MQQTQKSKTNTWHVCTFQNIKGSNNRIFNDGTTYKIKNELKRKQNSSKADRFPYLTFVRSADGVCLEYVADNNEILLFSCYY